MITVFAHGPRHRPRPLCFAADWFDVPEVVVVCVALLAVVVSGMVAIYAAFRWYRAFQYSSSIKNEALADLERALENQQELKPEELERVRAVIQQHQQNREPPEQ
jgi:hypothetical protein